MSIRARSEQRRRRGPKASKLIFRVTGVLVLFLAAGYWIVRGADPVIPTSYQEAKLPVTGLH